MRTVVELGLLPLVCARATDTDIAKLRELCDVHEAARKDGSYTVMMSFEFHLALAACAHNPASPLLLEALRDPILNSLHHAHHLGTSGVAEHRRVVEAIAARDLESATAEMSRHLNRTVEATAAGRR